MKKFVEATTKIGMLVLISIAALAASANAQTVGNGLRANIPFDFTVAGKKFAAGHYSITRVSQTDGDLVLKVSSLDEHSSTFEITSRLETVTIRNKSVLIFRSYGEEYFLDQVWAAGATTGRAFVKSRREKQLEQEQQHVAATDQKAPMVETVILTY